MSQLQTKFAGVGDLKADGRTVVGYASVFGSVDQGGDEIMPGAFDRTIAQKSAVPMLFGHNQDAIIGKFQRMTVDQKGLLVEGVLTPGLNRADEALALVKAGHLEGLSIGYRAKKFTLRDEKTANSVRELREIDLIEVSLVAFPMEPKAKIINLKSSGLQDREIRDAIKMAMRDAGYDLTRKEVEALCADGLKGLKAVRDASDQAENNSTELAALRRALTESFHL
jgi:uncharacterized protein